MATAFASSNRKVYFCGHCHQELSKTLFFSHKKLYYNKRLKKWQKDIIQADANEVEFVLSTEPDFSDYVFSDNSSDLEGKSSCLITSCSKILSVIIF